jgi:hypothetical protein
MGVSLPATFKGRYSLVNWIVISLFFVLFQNPTLLCTLMHQLVGQPFVLPHDISHRYLTKHALRCVSLVGVKSCLIDAEELSNPNDVIAEQLLVAQVFSVCNGLIALRSQGGQMKYQHHAKSVGLLSKDSHMSQLGGLHCGFVCSEPKVAAMVAVLNQILSQTVATDDGKLRAQLASYLPIRPVLSDLLAKCVDGVLLLEVVRCIDPAAARSATRFDLGLSSDSKVAVLLDAVAILDEVEVQNSGPGTVAMDFVDVK